MKGKLFIYGPNKSRYGYRVCGLGGMDRLHFFSLICCGTVGGLAIEQLGHVASQHTSVLCVEQC